MSAFRYPGWVALLVLAACGRPAPPPSTAPVPGPAVPAAPAAPEVSPSDALPAEPAFSIPPDLAFRQDRMPLHVTGIPEFLSRHPEWDGRGVLLAILDSGIDPGVAGLEQTSTGAWKLLDLRDYSGEGRIPLTRITPRGDSVAIGGKVLRGFGRVVLFNADGPWYGGLFLETPLGPSAGADVNGNGVVGDSLPVVVTRGSDGWLLLADTDLDGSLVGERPVHDYLAGHETLAWAAHRRAPRLTLAVNLREADGQPVLDLLFDTSGHGTHVAGIAAGHAMYGVPGFNGVAPGAQVIGLKIANDAQGGLSVTGSMVRALEHAIDFAARRRMPLVVNLSFGVGNEAEGAARIDRVLDSVLTAHPEVVMTVSAGNDGPGLSTMGFPGSARQVLTVGAVLPGARQQPAGLRHNPIAYFSARGGELAKPDLVAPGIAYSTVPRWDRGNETSSGTSMAAPHAAGLAALLTSALVQSGRAPDAALVRQALTVTARPVAPQGYVEQGAGVPDVALAWQWLSTHQRLPGFSVSVPDHPGWSALLLEDGADSAVFEVQRNPDDPPVQVCFRSGAEWLGAPEPMTLSAPRTRIALPVRRGQAPGAPVTGVVSAWTADTSLGPVFRLVTTLLPRAVPSSGYREPEATPIPAGSQRRLFIEADSGRPFEVRVTARSTQPVLVFLHEPGGMPARGLQPEIAGTGHEQVILRLDGQDVVRGTYQLVMVAPPSAGTATQVEVRAAQGRFAARPAAGGALVRADSGTTTSLALIGAARTVQVQSTGGDTVLVPVAVPSWAERVEVDLQLPPEQWAAFTDFGMSLYDSLGRQVARAPLDYAFGRLSADLPLGGLRNAQVLLFPGLPDPDSRVVWHGIMQIRLYSGSQVPLGDVSIPSGTMSPDPGARVYRLRQSPLSLPEGYDPLLLLRAEEGGIVWSREIPLYRERGE